jgi:hypothetical protein
LATKTKIAYSAGDGISIELVVHKGKLGFAVYNSGSQNCNFAECHGAIHPKENVPWLLPDLPIEYNDDYQLFNEVRDFIYDHVELPEDDYYDIMAAWTMAAYRFQEFESFPYICAIGPPGSGKTRLIKTLHQLSYRGLFGAGLTASAMFHAIDRDHVSIYYDQCEHLSNSKDAPDLLAIVDNGYQEGGKKYLTNTETGEYEAFNLYSPKAFASTRTLEETLESRSFRISMQARTRKISVRIDKKRAAILRSKLVLYKFRHSEGTEEIEEAEERLMKLTNDGRLIELFLPLYVVTTSSFPSGASAPSAKILNYMKRMNQIRTDEEQVSIDAQIVNAISECKFVVCDGKLAFDLIACEFNKERAPNEQWKIKTVAKKVRDLGFESCRMSDGSTGIYWNDSLLERHQRRFLVEMKPEAEIVKKEVTLPRVSEI